AGPMAAYENLPSLPLPADRMWSSVGVVCGQELHGGYQSRVFEGTCGGDRVVVKLSDSRLVDEAYRRRVEMTSLLAEIDDSVVGPLTTNVGIVVELGPWLAVVYPFVVGETPDICEEADVRRVATTMASLHRSLQQLDPIDLPTVAALAAAEPPINAAEFGQRQLLHGDFSPANLLFSERRVRVFDFDDCGYGPIEFEVGNTLYMVLFDAAMSSEMERYERFRAWFVDEYRSASSQGVPDELVDKSIGLRVQALGRWIDEPESAPIGIRTATPAWRDSLRAFVQSHTSH
ncbi:MAG TPA: phosphotransferase, partial [Ilumatobacteraceae bacterium]|nr:phosphotransferase [Ilumatobacteraceae bacterium]